MNILTPEQQKNKRAELKALIGQTVEFKTTSQTAQGTVIDFQENQEFFELTIDHSNWPVTWGKDRYTSTKTFMRKSDGGGDMKHVRLIK